MSQVLDGQKLVNAFELWAPKHFAIGSDREKVGLQIGTLNKPVQTILVTLDVLESVVDEAVALHADLIIAHHPLIFHPLKKLHTHTAQGRTIEKCLKHKIAVYVAHTNLDVAPGGVNDLLADALGLQHTEVLVPTFKKSFKKFVVYVPQDHAEFVRQALGEAGAGYIGRYSHCTFSSRGVGTFKPLEGSDAYIGQIGQRASVDEVRVETMIPAHLQEKVIQSVRCVHPYEEMAYDVYPLENEGEALGLGRIGILENDMTLGDFADHVKRSLDVEGVRVVGSREDAVKKVAVLGGDGNSFLSEARLKGADVFVTGDVYYHHAHDAWMEGLNVIDPGHSIEKVMKNGVKHFLEAFIAEQGAQTKVFSSSVNTDPFLFL